jgi:hypothetical protein
LQGYFIKFSNAIEKLIEKCEQYYVDQIFEDLMKGDINKGLI